MLFSFLLYTNIKRKEGGINEEEWDFLLKGGMGVGDPPEKVVPWMPNSSWDELCKLDVLESFKGILKTFVKTQYQWQAIYDLQVVVLTIL